MGYSTNTNLRPMDKEILEIVRELPGSTTAEILTLMPHVPRTTLYPAVSRLAAIGYLRASGSKVTVMGNGKQRKVATYTVADNPTPVAPTPKYRKSKKATPAGEAETIRLLREEIDELKAWKTAAEIRFPDLLVEPVVLTARKIVAETFEESGDHSTADLVRKGQRDKAPIMVATIRALEAAQ